MKDCGLRLGMVRLQHLHGQRCEVAFSEHHFSLKLRSIRKPRVRKLSISEVRLSREIPCGPGNSTPYD